MGLEGAKHPHGSGAIAGQVDGLCAVFHDRKIAAAYMLQNVAHFVHPTTLMQRARIDGLNGRG